MVRIREARIARDMTQLELANKLGVSQQAVCRWERGDSDLKASLIVELAKTLDVTANFLLGIDDVVDRMPSKEEEQLISAYNDLDEIGRARLIGYADGLAR